MNCLRALSLYCILLFFGQCSWAGDLKAWGYVAWWLPKGWQSVPLGEFDRLLIFDFPITSSGEIKEKRGWPDGWSELRIAATQHRVRLDLTLSLLDESTFLQLFASKQATQRLLHETIALAKDGAVGGVHLDIEVYGKVPTPVLHSFRDFVTRLSASLKALPQPRSLSVFVPLGGEVQLYDAPTMKHVGALVMQGYDAHWADGPLAGPVAPLDGPTAVSWKNASILGRHLGVASDKLFISFPFYGYEWPVQDRTPRSKTRGKAVSTIFAAQPQGAMQDMDVSVQERVKAYGAKRDTVSASSYYQYTNNQGQFFEGWFEDAWSLQRKTYFLQTQNLGGMAFFVLGYDNGLLVRQYFHLLGRSFQGSGV